MHSAIMQIDQCLIFMSRTQRTYPIVWRSLHDKLMLSWLCNDLALEGIALNEEELKRALSGGGNHVTSLKNSFLSGFAV